MSEPPRDFAYCVGADNPYDGSAPRLYIARVRVRSITDKIVRFEGRPYAFGCCSQIDIRRCDFTPLAAVDRWLKAAREALKVAQVSLDRQAQLVLLGEQLAIDPARSIEDARR